jgi:hypothetical protein
MLSYYSKFLRWQSKLNLSILSTALFNRVGAFFFLGSPNLFDVVKPTYEKQFIRAKSYLEVTKFPIFNNKVE